MRIARIVVALALVSTGILLAVFGGTDVNVITGVETHPNITQNESIAWGHGNTVLVAYNDFRGSNSIPANFCGLSVSTNGGDTFTRLSPSPFGGTNECGGNPSLFYSVRAAKWYVSFASGGCGSGVGIGQWESSDGITWVASGCIAVAEPVNRVFSNHSTWVDNNPASPFYATQYAAFNDNFSGNRAVATYSIDDGVNWTGPASVNTTSQRVVKVTGSLGSDGTVFIQTLFENGGGLNATRTNYIYRTVEQGAIWTEHLQGPTFFDASFIGPGRAACSDASGACMYASGYWWDRGWGQPGVGPNGVVHYVYSSRPSTTPGGDPGNIMYVRSTNNGENWSIPIQLNTDATTRAQWNPSLSVNAQGIVFVSWYDERNTVDDSLQRYGRASLDNGASWGTEMPLSDVVFPVPLRPDSSSSVGRYNHAMFSDDGYGGEAYHSWVDGRVSINGSPQQDIFFDKILLVPPTVYVVTTTDDHDDTACTISDCTLREAINAANAHAGSDIITFAAGVIGTIQLTGALPNLSSNIALQGPGANLLTVRRNTGGDYRLFSVTNGTSSGPTVSISDLSVTNGQVGGSTFPANSGGGIYNGRGHLTLTNVNVTACNAVSGGGICNDTGAAGTATLTIRSCTISGNSAPGNFGGGIYIQGTSSAGATTSLQNCTLSANTAFGGGGIFNFGSSSGKAFLTVLNCTFSANTATNASGIFNDASGADTATLTLGNTIFKAGTASNLLNTGTVISQGHNLSSDAAGGDGGTGPGGLLNGPGDIRNTDPLLDTLKDNGGPTLTHALLPGSPAINSGDDLLAPPIDQRGYLRAALSDRGALESDGIPLRVISITRNGAAVITFQAVAERIFRLERKLAMTDATWQGISGVDDLDVGATGPAQITDPGAASLGKAFYRVRLLP